MTEITPDQKKQLGNWADERDAILREISDARTEKETLQKENSELSISNSDLDSRINQTIGRLQVLEQVEKDRGALLPAELSELLVKIARAQALEESLKTHNDTLALRKAELKDDIKVLTEVHDRVYARVSLLDKVVDGVVRVSSQNTNDVSLMIKTLKDNIAEMERSLGTLNRDVFQEAQELRNVVTDSVIINAQNIKTTKELLAEVKDKAVEIGVDLNKQ